MFTSSLSRPDPDGGYHFKNHTDTQLHFENDKCSHRPQQPHRKERTTQAHKECPINSVVGNKGKLESNIVRGMLILSLFLFLLSSLSFSFSLCLSVGQGVGVLLSLLRVLVWAPIDKPSSQPTDIAYHTSAWSVLACPHYPRYRRMCVITMEQGSLRWLALAAGNGHVRGASTSWRTVCFSTDCSKIILRHGCSRYVLKSVCSASPGATCVLKEPVRLGLQTSVPEEHQDHNGTAPVK